MIGTNLNKPESCLTLVKTKMLYRSRGALLECRERIKMPFCSVRGLEFGTRWGTANWRLLGAVAVCDGCPRFHRAEDSVHCLCRSVGELLQRVAERLQRVQYGAEGQGSKAGGVL